MKSMNQDPGLRRVAETDISAIAELFRARYPEGYPRPEVFDGTWVNRCIYNDDIICLVLEENGRVIGTGALLLDLAIPTINWANWAALQYIRIAKVRATGNASSTDSLRQLRTMLSLPLVKLEPLTSPVKEWLKTPAFRSSAFSQII